MRFRFGLVLGGRGAVSPSGTSSFARSWCAVNGIGGTACRHAAHWQRVWYMLGGSLRNSRISRAASRRERPKSEDCCLSSDKVCSIAMSEVTRILSAIEQGDPQAAEQLLPLVYDQLRELAAEKLVREKPGQTLQATALVHEAYLRLVGGRNVPRWDSRGHFFAAAAQAMRRILLNRARDKKRIKRGGERRRLDLDQLEIALDANDDQVLALDEALTELAEDDPDAARLVNLRFFAGLSLKDAAAAMGLAQRTAERQWAYARAWLFARLSPDDNDATPTR
jgi:RNA polymerase sigma factor (TIGR02999 family)